MDVRKTVTDAGYIAIGLGVMGYQQTPRHCRFSPGKLRLRRRTSRASARGPRSRASSPKAAARSAPAASPPGAAPRSRCATTVTRCRVSAPRSPSVEPVVGQVQSQLGDLPERAGHQARPPASRLRGSWRRFQSRTAAATCGPRPRALPRVRPRSALLPLLRSVCWPPVHSGRARSACRRCRRCSFPRGLVRAVPPDEVVAIVNTGDDDEFHGLHVSPDLDSVTYTLAGASNAAQGWGLEGETFATLDALARYDVPDLVPPRRQGPGDPPLPHATPARGRDALGGDRRDHARVGPRPAARADDRRPRAHAHHGDARRRPDR